MPLFLRVACRTAAGRGLSEPGGGGISRLPALGITGRLVRASPTAFRRNSSSSSRLPRPVRTLLFVGQWLPMKGIRYFETPPYVCSRMIGHAIGLCRYAGSEGAVKAEFPPAH